MTVKYLEIIVDDQHNSNQLSTRSQLAELLGVSYQKIVQMANERGIIPQCIGGIYIYNASDFGLVTDNSAI